MSIDKASFMVALGALAAGGAGGYLAGERGELSAPSRSGATERQPPPGASPGASSAGEPLAARAAPACDDMVGAARPSPSPGYAADEGGCGALPATRCEDFKRVLNHGSPNTPSLA